MIDENPPQLIAGTHDFLSDCETSGAARIFLPGQARLQQRRKSIFAQHLLHRLRRQRPREKISLDLVAAHILQGTELLHSLYLFCQYLHPETLPHGGHSVDDRSMVFVALKVAHEGLVHFQGYSPTDARAQQREHPDTDTIDGELETRLHQVG
jgi:hypothetical protein